MEDIKCISLQNALFLYSLSYMYEKVTIKISKN